MEPSVQTTPAVSSSGDALPDVLRQLKPGSYISKTLQLILNSHSLVSVTNCAGKIIYANDRFCEVSKYSREELIGQTHRIVRSDYHPPAFYEEIWSTISSGKGWSGNIQNKDKEGTIYWLQTTINRIFDEKNRIIGYASMHTDVTAQRQQISELNDSKRKAYATLHSAIDILDSSMLIVDASGHIVTSNQAYSAMYPESAEEERAGNHFKHLVKIQRPELSSEEIEDYVQQVITKDTTEQHTLADGRIVKIQRRIAPGGGFVSLHTDISDVVRQTKLLESQAETMDLMKAIAVDANESADIETAYNKCLERICKFTGWEVGHVYIPCDDGSGRCRPANSWYCVGSGMCQPFKEQTQSTIFDIGQDLPGRVFQSGKPAWLHDVTTDKNFLRAQSARQLGIVGGAAFPVKIREEVVAILEFYSTQPIDPNPQLDELLSHVCAQMSRVAERERAEKTLMTRVASELRKRDRKLVEQNERFNAALKNMSQGLCMFDSEKRLIVSNNRYAQMYDLSPDILKPGVTLRQILEYRIANGIYAGGNPEEYFKEREEWVTSGVRSSKIQELSDGRSMSITHQPMSGGGWLTTHEDITGRVVAEKARQESQELFSKAFHASPAAISIADPDSGIIYDINEAWMSMFGFSLEEIREKSAFQLGIWVNGQERHEFVAQVKANGSVKDVEVRLRNKEGRLIDALVSCEQVEIGGELRLLFASHDITERKKANEALRENEQRFKDIVDISSDWFWEMDENLRFTYHSPRYYEITGFRPEDKIGTTRTRYVGPAGLDRDTGKWAAHMNDMEARRPFKNFEFDFKTKDGATIYARISGTPVFDDEGNFQGYRGAGADISERRLAEEELTAHRDHLQELVDAATKDLKAKAEELNKALGKEKELNELQRQFVSMASHEFRTPLAIIDSTAQRILRKVETLTPQDTANRVEKIRSAVVRMTRLMERTLEAARIENGKIDIEIDDCDLRYVILEVEMHQIEMSPNHNISCDLKDLPDTVRGDNGAMVQIFTNLISNAVKYSPDAPDIHVRGWTEGKFAVVEVKDHGLGIGEQDMPKMFQRFFRAETSSGIAGTGIGLNLVKTLVELHDGSICVQSKIDAGSVFTVRLPLQGPAKIDSTEGQAA